MSASAPSNPLPGPDPGDANPEPERGFGPGACRLPADACWHLVRTLRLTLPPPPGDGREDLLRRDHAAIARVAALAPANAAEADVAAQFVAASEQWKDCLRLAQQSDTTPDWAAKCRAQAMGMMRQANSAMRLLLRMQEARRKLDADNHASDRAARAEHAAMRLMADALEQIRAEPDPLVAPAPAKAEVHSAAKIAEARNSVPVQQPQPSEADLVAAAERYAAAYPERAASIRRTGRLPCDVRYFDPPEAALARALIAGQTPPLAALDHAFPDARAA